MKAEYRPLNGIQRCYPVLVIIASGPEPNDSNRWRCYVLEGSGQSQPRRGFDEAVLRSAHERGTPAPRGNNFSAHREQSKGAAGPDLAKVDIHDPRPYRPAGAETSRTGAHRVRPRLRVRPTAIGCGYLPSGPLADRHSAAQTNLLASKPKPSFSPKTPCRPRAGTLGATHVLNLDTETAEDAPCRV